ncbi:MAG TPA: alpha/beta hydrolase [Kribbella sp.]|uniref:alpha/beta fold hydrolase n=1 Tax=Kribbella sp. TaxID=1871183 RepID=UPI002D7966B9|nr:alpha/beta hydrolase [Kribbella sp.]HET6293498.1 alpha/beta hydrolase [Kribbella sp.]
MPTFSAPDGTVLAYRLVGEGDPVICLPGGPMQDAEYLGDLGGLVAHRQMVLLDPRGTGQSAVPEDVSSYRADRLVGDVEALREHLGLERFDLLAHSGGTNLATLYAAKYPERVAKLALITPSPFAVGLAITGENRLEIARLRKNDQPEAVAAMEAIVTGQATDDSWKAIDPLFYGRWDAAAQAHHAAQDGHRNDEAAAIYGSDGAYDPATTRTALAAFEAPVLVLAGEVDLNSPPAVVAEFAALFPKAEFVIQPGAGHFPWVDDPDRFVATTAEFLRK